ncbi:DUF1311 domain-containing protein [Bacillus sp. NP157]|nr:DUF1311 domain-containing protein [Bacillus sp. NP157]
MLSTIGKAWIVMSCALSVATVCAATQDGIQEHGAIKIRPSYQACLDATGGVTPALKECMSSEFSYQDKRLNVAYKKLMASLAPGDRATLRSEELGWIGMKRSRCDAGAEAGQADELVAYDCAVVETAKRATELEDRGAR